MRVAAVVSTLVLAFSIASCGQDVLGPPTAEESPAFEVTVDQQTGPSNECYGAIVASIANTWPWAHEDHASFPPPPGSIALWIETFGPFVGVSSVRDLQLLFCAPT